MTNPFAIIGTGRVASSLGRVLRERGAPLQWIAGRDPQHTRIAADFVGGVEALPLESVASAATRVLIAVSDSAIAEVAQRLASTGFTDGIALHTAGSRGPEALAPLAAEGVSTGVLYPLQTFPTPAQGALSLPGTYFAVTGDQRARDWAEQILNLIPGKTSFGCAQAVGALSRGRGPGIQLPSDAAGCGLGSPGPRRRNSGRRTRCTNAPGSRHSRKHPSAGASAGPHRSGFARRL